MLQGEFEVEVIDGNGVKRKQKQRTPQASAAFQIPTPSAPVLDAAEDDQENSNAVADPVAAVIKKFQNKGLTTPFTHLIADETIGIVSNAMEGVLSYATNPAKVLAALEILQQNPNADFSQVSFVEDNDPRYNKANLQFKEFAGREDENGETHTQQEIITAANQQIITSLHQIGDIITNNNAQTTTLLKQARDGVNTNPTRATIQLAQEFTQEFVAVSTNAAKSKAVQDRTFANLAAIDTAIAEQRDIITEQVTQQPRTEQLIEDDNDYTQDNGMLHDIVRFAFAAQAALQRNEDNVFGYVFYLQGIDFQRYTVAFVAEISGLEATEDLIDSTLQSQHNDDDQYHLFGMCVSAMREIGFFGQRDARRAQQAQEAQSELGIDPAVLQSMIMSGPQ